MIEIVLRSEYKKGKANNCQLITNCCRGLWSKIIFSLKKRNAKLAIREMESGCTTTTEAEDVEKGTTNVLFCENIYAG